MIGSKVDPWPRPFCDWSTAHQELDPSAIPASLACLLTPLSLGMETSRTASQEAAKDMVGPAWTEWSSWAEGPVSVRYGSVAAASYFLQWVWGGHGQRGGGEMEGGRGEGEVGGERARWEERGNSGVVRGRERGGREGEVGGEGQRELRGGEGKGRGEESGEG